LGFFGKFLIAVFADFVARGAWANCTCQWDTCDDNEYCNVLISYPYPGNPEYSYECTPCPNGQVPSNSCLACVPDGGGEYCDSFQDPCPSGLGPEYRCKVSQQDCGSGCTKYKTCDSTNGNVGPDALSENCHIEGQTCYSNTRACSEFATRSDVITCPQENQSGTAEWASNHWVVDNCECAREHDVFTTFNLFGAPIPMWCDDFYATYSVSTNSMVNTVQDKIIYTTTSVYCKKCHKGYLPEITEANNNNGFAVRPLGVSGNWGVFRCPTKVEQPHYAPGCTINFNETDTDVVMASCRKECPLGFGTETDGATQIEQCKSDGTPYEDGTGYFIIPELASCD